LPKPTEARQGSHQGSNHVAREIANLIVTGRWREGFTLPREIELALQFDVSRTSIRESLSILKAKGLIVARQKAGTHVRERINWNMLDAELLEWTWAQRPTEEFARQLLQVRRIVEPEASAICAERGSDADLARIERAYREMDAAGTDSRAYFEPDLRFHRAILTAIATNSWSRSAPRWKRRCACRSSCRRSIPARRARACPTTARCWTRSGRAIPTAPAPPRTG